MDLATFKNMPVASMLEIVPHVPGWYIGRCSGIGEVEERKDKNDNNFVTVTLLFRVEEPLEGQSMKDTSPNRQYPLKIRIFKEEDTSRLVGIGKTLRPDVPTPIELRERGEEGGNTESYLEQMVGAPARVLLAFDDWQLEKNGREVLVVESVRKVS